jgi:hypothetical protein
MIRLLQRQPPNNGRTCVRTTRSAAEATEREPGPSPLTRGTDWALPRSTGNRGAAAGGPSRLVRPRQVGQSPRNGKGVLLAEFRQTQHHYTAHRQHRGCAGYFLTIAKTVQPRGSVRSADRTLARIDPNAAQWTYQQRSEISLRWLLHVNHLAQTLLRRSDQTSTTTTRRASQSGSWSWRFEDGKCDEPVDVGVCRGRS